MAEGLHLTTKSQSKHMKISPDLGHESHGSLVGVHGPSMGIHGPHMAHNQLIFMHFSSDLFKLTLI